MLSCREMTVAFLTVSVSERPAYGQAPRESVRASIESMYEYEKNLFGPRKEDAERCGNGNVGFFFAGSEGIKYMDVGKEEKMFLFRILIRT